MNKTEKLVIKRDGKVQEFNEKRISNAIFKAAIKVIDSTEECKRIANTIAEKVKNKIKNYDEVEKIQDFVVKQLMTSKWKDVATEYVEYRHKRDIARKSKTKDMFLEIINAKSNDVTRENANMNADTPAGMMMKFASETTKPFVDDFLLKREVNQAIEDNYIWVHDKDYYPTKSLTCLQHPLDKILQDGFRAGHGASRPAKRIETASMLGCISMETVQNEMHGGQAVPALDFYLAPYVRATYIEELDKISDIAGFDLSHLHNVEVKDYLLVELSQSLDSEERYKQIAINNTVKRVHQALEAFIHNMNTIHSRGGNQVVFSSVNYGTDTSPEGRCIIRELLHSTYKGVGNSETAIFPIQIWKKKRGVSYLPEDPNYDLYKLACKVTARRFFPNFINLDAPFNQHEKWDANDPKRYEYEAATMGCRTRVFENRHGEKTSIGRGNLSFTTINLPKLAIEASLEIQEKYGIQMDLGLGTERSHKEEMIEIFKKKIKEQSDTCKDQLLDRFKLQSTALVKQFPLLMGQLWQDCETLDPNDTIESVIKHGSLSIGFIGLAEALIVLLGDHHGASEESQAVGVEAITLMRDLCSEYSEETDLNYSVIATPAEGLSGRFTKGDTKDFGVIKGVTDKEYYTNSSHVPVWYKCSSEQKAKVESVYHDLTRAGHIFYIEQDGDAAHNPESVAAIVDLMDKYNIGYGSVNHSRTRCMACGFETSEEITECPKCSSSNLDTIQRITGYLVGTTDRWNQGKLAEMKDRITHN